MGSIVGGPPPLRVRLIGNFQVLDGEGQDVAPRGAKARALVAMLALTSGGRRRRRWIESRLWSDRGPEQASGSLRQALMEIRKALGPAAACLRADRDEVILEPLSADLEEDPDGVAEALGRGRDLLEGFDIRDEAFEEWLREERARLRTRLGERNGPSQPAALPMLVLLGDLPPGLGGFLGAAIGNGIAQMLAQFAFVTVHAEAGRRTVLDLPDRGLTLGVEVAARGSALHAMAAIMSRHSRSILWSRTATFGIEDADLIQAGEFPALIFEAVDATVAALARTAGAEQPGERANGLLGRAVAGIFSYQGPALRLADRHLSEAEALWPSGLIHAWRAFARQVMLIERTEDDRVRLTEEADAHARRAVEAAEGNPLALALASMARVMLDADAVAGAVLAGDAMALGPQNPFCHAAKAGVLLRGGDPREAWRLASEGSRIAARSRLVHWWETLAGTAALAAGRLDQASAHFEAAHARAPTFRVPMRHLVCLYIARGEPALAEAMMRKLALVEPDFSLERIAADPDYPAATLRRTGLIGARPVHA